MIDRHDPNLILDYVEDQLSVADRARFEESLTRDPALASLVADMKRDRDALRSTPPFEPPADIADAAMQTLERQLLLDHSALSLTAEPPAPSRWRIIPILAYGSIAAVLLLTVSLLFHFLQSEQPEPSLATERPGFDIAQAPIDAQDDALKQSIDGLDTKDANEAMGRAASAPAPAAQPEPPALPAKPAESLAATGGVGRTADGRLQDQPADGPMAMAKELDVAASADAQLLAELADAEPLTDHLADNRRFDADTPAFAWVDNAPVKLTVQTASAEGTRRQLEDWAQRNNAAIAFDHPLAGEASRDLMQPDEMEQAATQSMQVTEALPADDTPTRADTSRKVVMVIEKQRLSDLQAMIERESTASFKRDLAESPSTASRSPEEAGTAWRGNDDTKAMARSSRPAAPATAPAPPAVVADEAAPPGAALALSELEAKEEQDPSSFADAPRSKSATASTTATTPAAESATTPARQRAEMLPARVPWLSWLESTQADGVVDVTRGLTVVEVFISEQPAADTQRNP